METSSWASTMPACGNPCHTQLLAKELSRRKKKSEKLVACSNVVGKVEGVVCQP
jgi:hypothetical protein